MGVGFFGCYLAILCSVPALLSAWHLPTFAADYVFLSFSLELSQFK